MIEGQRKFSYSVEVIRLIDVLEHVLKTWCQTAVERSGNCDVVPSGIGRVRIELDEVLHEANIIRHLHGAENLLCGVLEMLVTEHFEKLRGEQSPVVYDGG